MIGNSYNIIGYDNSYWTSSLTLNSLFIWGTASLKNWGESTTQNWG